MIYSIVRETAKNHEFLKHILTSHTRMFRILHKVKIITYVNAGIEKEILRLKAVVHHTFKLLQILFQDNQKNYALKMTIIILICQKPALSKICNRIKPFTNVKNSLPKLVQYTLLAAYFLKRNNGGSTERQTETIMYKV